MKYEIQNNLLQTISKQFAQPQLRRRQIVLFSIFGLLLLLVIICCTVSPSPIAAVALIVALAIGSGALLRPSIAVLLVFIGAGLPSLLVPLPGHNMRPLEAALWLGLLVIILRHPRLCLRLPHLLALLFLAIVVVSFIHVPEISTSPDAYTADKRFYGMLLLILALFTGTFLAGYIKDASSFLVTVLIGNFPLYLISLAQALGIPIPSLLLLSNPAQSDGRLPGPFGGAVGFGMYLVNLFAIAIACWLLSKRRSDRIIGAIMTIATALAIVGSGTRSVAIGTMVITIVSFILTRRFKLLAGVSALASITVAIFFNTILSRFSHSATSSSNRLFLWQEACKLIISHPWIGIGLWQFPKYYALLVVSLGSQLNPHGGISIHEQYLEWAMESGIFCLIIGVLLLLSIIYSCRQAYRLAQSQQQILLLATILAVLANMVIGFFDVPLDEIEGAVFLFLLAGLSLGYAEQIRSTVLRQKTADGISHSRSRATSSVAAPQTTNPTDIGSLLCRLPSMSSQVHLPGLPSSSPATRAVSSASASAPDTQKTGRSVIIQLLSWAIPIPIIFPMTALLTHYLGPVRYGEYNFTISFFSVLVLFSGNGIDPLILRQLNRKPRAEWSELLGYALGARLLAIVVLIIVAVLIALVLPISVELHNLLLLGSVSLCFSFSIGSLRTTFEIGFRKEQRVAMISLLATTNRIITAGLASLIVIFHLPFLWACFLLIYSDLPFFVIQMLIARRNFGMQVRFSLVRARELLLHSIPLISYNIMALIASQADLLLLMALAGAQSVGLYALASRITDPLLSVVLAYTLNLYPLLCAKFEEGYEQFAVVYQEATRILALAIFPLAIFVSVEAQIIVASLGGQHFAAATIAVQLLMWAMAATFFNQLAVRACMAAHMERQMMYITIASSTINVLANLVLIPHWQIMGAGTAALLSEFLGFGLFTILLRRHIQLFSTMGVVLRVFLGNLPMLLFLIWQQRTPLPLTIPLALLLVIAGCLVTRTLSLKDVHLIQRIIHNRQNKGTAKDISDQPTLILPPIQDIADYPTLILPKI